MLLLNILKVLNEAKLPTTTPPQGGGQRKILFYYGQRKVECPVTVSKNNLI
jgi:hypothetical protein